MKTRQEVKAGARELLRQNRGLAIALALVPILITFVSAMIDVAVYFVTGTQGFLYWLVYFAGMIVIMVMYVNMFGEFIKIWNGDAASVGELFNGFKVNFLRKLGGVAWMYLWVMLWSLLFVIPGIVKSYSYYFTMSILANMPNVTARQALKISMKMTRGYKMQLFVFDLSFLGWFILSVFTFGILGVVFVMPYYCIAVSGMYVEFKNRALAEGILTQEEIDGGEFAPANAN